MKGKVSEKAKEAYRNRVKNILIEKYYWTGKSFNKALKSDYWEPHRKNGTIPNDAIIEDSYFWNG